MHHANPLLKHNRGTGITLDKWFISHEESTHELKHGDLDREVEGCDHTHWTERPAIARIKLTSMVARLSDRVSQEAHTISAKVFHEVKCHLKLCGRLLRALRCDSLDAPHEEIEDLWVVHDLYHLTIHFTEHQVSLLILERIVKTGLWDSLQTFDEWRDLVHRGVGYFDHFSSIKWINKLIVLGCRCPLSLHQVETFVRRRQILWINSRESFQMLGNTSQLYRGAYHERTIKL